ncbi:hypothetical protein DXV76_12740 [Rhodobacteraceae bacterium CCMM004]|nr:hypothetical protein DXV76_12740 [Rhodobacteraceae bacterium CCMM004]
MSSEKDGSSSATSPPRDTDVPSETARTGLPGAGEGASAQGYARDLTPGENDGDTDMADTPAAPDDNA